MSLFRAGDFTLHSGEQTNFLIECAWLHDADLFALTLLIENLHGRFGQIEGVPRGGLPLARHAKRWLTDRDDDRLLIVDDVLTTGASMEEHRAGREAVGVVIFARGPCPDWVTPLFTMATP